MKASWEFVKRGAERYTIWTGQVVVVVVVVTMMMMTMGA